MSIKEISDQVRAHYNWYQMLKTHLKAQKKAKDEYLPRRRRYKEITQLKRRRTMGINKLENHDKDYHFNKAFDEKLAQQEKEKEYADLFTNSASDEAYMAHVVDGNCLCWHGDIECGATAEERQDILNFRKGFTQDWWEKNS